MHPTLPLILTIGLLALLLSPVVVSFLGTVERRAREEAQMEARRFASERWEVVHRYEFEEGLFLPSSIQLILRSLLAPKEVPLAFDDKHPATQEICRLPRGSVIGFSFQEDGLSDIPGTRTCSYLQLDL